MASADFPTRWGHFLIHGFTTRTSASNDGGKTEEAVALVMGEVHSGSPLVRIHSQCLTGDVFGSLRCDCGDQLHHALEQIEAAGKHFTVASVQNATLRHPGWSARSSPAVALPPARSLLPPATACR